MQKMKRQPATDDAKQNILIKHHART